MNDRIAVDVAEGVAHVRLNRADKLNALDPAMFAAIAEAIERIGAMRDVRSVVLSGEGRAFCAGLDMVVMESDGGGLLTDERTHGIANLAQQVCWGWRALPQPVIAAIHGVAFGGGLQIASGADVRIVAADARLAVRELHWGIVPDMAGFALWHGTVRDDHLREALYTAREFGGEEAVRLGFATRVAADPLAEAMVLARTIASRNPDAIRAVKRLVGVAAAGDAAATLLAESTEQMGVFGRPNHHEQVRAHLEKRAPRFPD